MQYTVKMWGASGGVLESGFRGSEQQCATLIEQVMGDMLSDGWAAEVFTTGFTLRHPVNGDAIGGLRIIEAR